MCVSRVLASPKEAIQLINWGEVGKLQIEEAMRVAKEKFGICFQDAPQKTV